MESSTSNLAISEETVDGLAQLPGKCRRLDKLALESAKYGRMNPIQ